MAQAWSTATRRTLPRMGFSCATVLLAVASKHGSTREIAEAIAAELRSREISVAIRDVGAVDDIAPFDAVIVGSAVYLGHWLAEARQFIDTHQAALWTKPVWLFSSGPIGIATETPSIDLAEVNDLVEAARARGHEVFKGKLEPGRLGFGERILTKVVHAPAGDFREWPAIRDWAGQIADSLLSPAEATADPEAESPSSREG